MPSVPGIVQQRRKRRLAHHRKSYLPAGMGCGLLFSWLVIAASAVLAYYYIDLTRNLPSPEALPILLDPPGGILLQPTRLYDRSENHILLAIENPDARHPSEQGRRFLPLDSSTPSHIPEAVIWATTAAADPGFWSHPGLTLSGLTPGGRQTLAQRLVSDILFWNEPPGWRRKIREGLLAVQITARFGRHKILEWYLNSAKYGRLVYGVDAAARVYFDKPAEELDLAEAALLAAVAEAPELNPLEAPQIPLERQKGILGAMLDQGLIEPEQANQASQTRLRFRQSGESHAEIAPAFTNLVLEQLSSYLPLERIERGGLRIRTSLDYTLQTQSSCAVESELARRDSLQPAPPPTSIDGTPCEAARLLPSSNPLSSGQQESLEAQVIILEPNTGQVLALVGSLAPGLDPAHLPGQPSGTLITPFIYLTAFTRGWSPASLAWDIPNNIPSAASVVESASIPTNSGISSRQPTSYQGPVSLRSALANDYQAPAVGLLAQLGPEQVWRTERQLGLGSLQLGDLHKVLDHQSLFTDDQVTLLEIAQAFGVFASGGFLAGQNIEKPGAGNEFPPIQPVTVLRVEGIDHQVWMDCQDEFTNCSPLIRPVLSPQLAYLITHVLSDETARWPSLRHPNPLEIGRPAGAKIGITGEGKSAWTVGYTPQLVVGVWTGVQETRSSLITQSQDEPSPDDQVGAAHSAPALWHAIIKYASLNLPPQNWLMPPGISQIEVCEPSGMLPTQYCPSVVREIFINGNEPTYPDTLYRVYQVNRETGRLATVFTPSALVEDQVYLAIPAQAQDWARASGVPMPPDLYDVITQAPAASASARIEFPAMFAYVNGKVQIRGNAAGEDFSFYRIQAGQGLNPQEWLQIGSNVDQPVRDGLLGEWDTQGLSGLYALQLMVVRKDQRVDSAIIQVTIDNLPPDVRILQPSLGSDAYFAQQLAVVFEADATDDLALAQVTFFIDEAWAATLSQPPYVIAWKPVPGKHLLVVRATDKAGNTSEVSLEFQVSP